MRLLTAVRDRGVKVDVGKALEYEIVLEIRGLRAQLGK